MSVGLLLVTAFVAAPTFTHGNAADTAFGSSAFGSLWSGIEPAVPNFWGPTVLPALTEPYQEATNGSRLVQYFDKARMEQTTASGPVTNGLLTVEMITGRRQMGDASFIAFPSSKLPVVGDPTNTWPPYSAFGGNVFAAKVSKSGDPTGTVYKPDGTFGINPGLGADPGAQFGAYQADPGARFAHNIPSAFSSYLTALPIPWLSTMGLPLTEAVWVNVNLGGIATWVLVQPYERRVLSYTPTNPAGFQVEMGNIGQHYYRWRYTTNPGINDALGGDATPSLTTTPTTQGTPTGTISGTSGTLAIASVQLGTVTDTGFSLTFKTSTAATTEILYGTASHSYTSRQDISTMAAMDHAVNLTDLQPGTKYYFALRATAGGTSVQNKENFFTTAGTATTTTTTKTPKPPTVTPTISSTDTPTNTPTPTTDPTNTPTPTNAPTPTNTPKPATPTATPVPTATSVPKSVRMTLTQVVVGAASPALLTPPVIQLDSSTVALSLAYDGSSNAITGTANPTNWMRDPTHATATSNTASNPLSLTDKQTPLTLSAKATIPFVDPTSPALVVTFTQRISPSDYTPGTTLTTPPLSNARNPGYNVTMTFSVALVG